MLKIILFVSVAALGLYLFGYYKIIAHKEIKEIKDDFISDFL